MYTFIGALLPQSDLHELSKISVLLQHFERHQALHPHELSFVDFLRMHYEDADHMQAENHDGLPLKKMGNSPYDFFVKGPFLTYEQVVLHSTTPKHLVTSEPGFNNRFTGSVWQPPQRDKA